MAQNHSIHHRPVPRSVRVSSAKARVEVLPVPSHISRLKRRVLTGFWWRSGSGMGVGRGKGQFYPYSIHSMSQPEGGRDRRDGETALLEPGREGLGMGYCT